VKLAKPVISFDIADEKSASENIESYKAKLNEIDPVLGPLLADLLPSLMKEPNGDKTVMLDHLRAALDAPAGPTAE
jgi:hypothetical protein